MKTLVFAVLSCLVLCFISSCNKEEITLNDNVVSTTSIDQQTLGLVENSYPVFAPAPQESISILKEILNGGGITPPVIPPHLPSLDDSRTGEHFKVFWTTTAPSNPKVTFIDASPLMERASEVLNNPCAYGQCELIIPNIKDELQKIANQHCTDQYFALSCCHNGDTLYAIVVAYHQCAVDTSTYHEQ